MDKNKFINLLNKKLSKDQKEMFGIVSVEQQKDFIVFRMPVGLVGLESTWEIAVKLAAENNVVIKQAGVFATLDELDDLLGNIEWLWNKWIPKGFVTMIAGDPGIGKSAFVQWLVKIITEGKAFPLEDKPLGKSGNCIWVDTEASQQILMVRANTMNINKKRVYLPVINGDILSQANLGFEQDREQLINLVEGVKPELLVLDSLGGSHTRGENKVEDIRPVLEFLALLSRDNNMSSIVVHHLNKGKADESPEVSLYRLRGSTIIPAMCRSIFAIEKSFDGTNKIRMVKANLTKGADPITVTPTFDQDEEISGFEFSSYTPPAPKRSKKDNCADWIFQQLVDYPEGRSPKELEEIAQGAYTRQNLYTAKDILGDRITFSGTGNTAVWMVTQKDNATIKNILSSNGNGKHANGKKAVSSNGSKVKSKKK